jgi:phage shock protein E
MSLLARFLKCTSSRGRDTAQAPIDLDAAEFVHRRTAGAPVLDVRSAGEFASRHLEGARNVDIMASGFLDQVAQMGLDPDAPIYLYCRSGNRSRQAARVLRQNGYTHAVNVGGLDDLVREGAPATAKR